MADLPASEAPSEIISLLSHISDPLLLVDSTGSIVAANAATSALAGWSVEELTDLYWAGLDAQLTTIYWKLHWKKLGSSDTTEYTTDILTKQEFLCPVSVRITKVSTDFALVALTDSIEAQVYQEQLEALSQSTGAGTFFFNRISNKLWISSSARNLLGLTETAELKEITEYCRTTFSQEEWKLLTDNFHARLGKPGPASLTITAPHKERKERLLVEGRSVGNALNVTHIFGTIREEEKTSFTVAGDITEELARFSIDEALEMIFWTKPNGSISYVNQSVVNKLGYSREQIKEGGVTLIAPYFNEDYRTTFWQQLREQRTFSAEFEIFMVDGSPIPITAEVNYLNIGEEEYACSFCRDLTKTRRRTALLELSQTALDKTRDSVIWLDEDFTISYVNNKVVDLFGEKNEYWTGRSFQVFFPGIKKQDIVNGDTLEVTVVNRSGDEIAFELRTDTIKANAKQFYMLLGRDISLIVKREKKLQNALQKIQDLKERLEQENVSLREEVSTNYNINNIITVSPKYHAVLEKIGQVAEVDTTVLITGETGTGKELLARAIHQLSEREDKPLIKVNCAALPESLIESELFGHEKGAFTGAVKSKKGRFELADGGTLFLDEVGEMPLDLQAKLLRVLQEGEFEKLGGTETVSVDVRLIAATNRNLEKMVQEGRFRIDLYYRLNVFPINNPPLRNRPEDIPVLIEYFAKKYAREQGKTITEINSKDLEKIKKYSFPGNVRELENIVERAVVLCRSKVLRLPFNKQARSSPDSKQPLLSFEDMQRKHIIEALKATNGRITGPQGAGVLLDLNDRTLMSKIRKLKIQKREYLL